MPIVDAPTGSPDDLWRFVSVGLVRLGGTVDLGELHDGARRVLPNIALAAELDTDRWIERHGLVVAAVGLHADLDEALDAVDRMPGALSTVAIPTHHWVAVLEPFAHRGTLNWRDRTEPAPAFRTSDSPSDDDSFVVITTSGWTLGPAFDPARAEDFADGVERVLESMDGTPGLRWQHAFTFELDPSRDPITITRWDDDRSMRAFAYRPGPHETELRRFRELATADRTSFTRCAIRHERGTWPPHGDAAAPAGHPSTLDVRVEER